MIPFLLKPYDLWYIFYHRSSNHSQYLRRLSAEPIFFDEDGLIHEVKMTSQAAGDPLCTDEVIPASLACEYRGGAYLETIETPEGSVKMEPGSEALFRYVRNENVVKEMIVNGTGNSEMQICADGNLIGKGRLNQPLQIELDSGIHEFVIANNEEPVTIHSFRMI